MSAPIISPEPEAYQDDERPEVTERWEIGSIDEADWALAKLARYRKEIADAKRLEAKAAEWHQLQLEKLAANTAKITASAERSISFFEGHLYLYATKHREELLGKKQSRNLPSGRIGFRARPEQLKVVDEDALLAWCRAQPVESEVLRIEEAPNLPAVKAHTKATGELLPGTEIELATETFYAKEE